MTETESISPNLGLGEILRVLRLRWRRIAAVTVIVFGIVLGFTLSQSKQYRATAVLLVRTVAADTASQADPNYQVPDYAARQLMNAEHYLESTAQIDAVKARYHGHIKVTSVTVTALTDGSDAIDLSVTGTNAKDAADLVNLYGNIYIEDANATVRATLQTGETVLQQEIAALKTQQDQVSAPLLALKTRQAANPTDAGLQAQIQTLTVQIEPQLAAIENKSASDELRLQDLKASSGLLGQDSAALTTQATPPSSPISPKPVRNGAIGFVLGLGLGIAYALVREYRKPVPAPTDLIDLADPHSPAPYDAHASNGSTPATFVPVPEREVTEPVPALRDPAPASRRARTRTIAEPTRSESDGFDASQVPTPASPARRVRTRPLVADSSSASVGGLDPVDPAPASPGPRRERRRPEPKATGAAKTEKLNGSK